MKNLPMFYKNPLPLNRETQATLTVGSSPRGFQFAASAQFVLLTGVEFFDAGRQFPIIFTATADKKILPVALLGLEKGNLTIHGVSPLIRRGMSLSLNIIISESRNFRKENPLIKN